MADDPLRSKAATAFRYGFVSAICLVLHNAIVIGGDLIGIHYFWSCTISFVSVASAGFVLHARFTFGVAARLEAFPRYCAAMALNLPLNIILIWLLHDVMRLPLAIASPGATLILVAWNYAASRWAIVPERTRRGLSR